MPFNTSIHFHGIEFVHSLLCWCLANVLSIDKREHPGPMVSPGCRSGRSCLVPPINTNGWLIPMAHTGTIPMIGLGSWMAYTGPFKFGKSIPGFNGYRGSLQFARAYVFIPRDGISPLR